jgi:hypothetical protein
LQAGNCAHKKAIEQIRKEFAQACLSFETVDQIVRGYGHYRREVQEERERINRQTYERMIAPGGVLANVSVPLSEV